MIGSAPSQVHARLKVFLAAARGLSFTQAGEPLHITIQAAIAGMGIAIARRTFTTVERVSGVSVASVRLRRGRPPRT